MCGVYVRVCTHTQVRLKDNFTEVRIWSSSLLLETVLLPLRKETFLDARVPFFPDVAGHSSLGNP